MPSHVSLHRFHAGILATVPRTNRTAMRKPTMTVLAASLPDKRTRKPDSPPSWKPRIDIPLRDPSPEAEAQDQLVRRGRHLARQDAWDDLGREICAADASRSLTPGLTPAALWLARGARQDAVGAARKAIARNEPNHARAAIRALEANLEDMPDCPALAFVVCNAHLDLARAWRGGLAMRGLSRLRRAAYDHHMRSAVELVEANDPFEQDSALWAMARCAVLDADPAPSQRVADDYEDLVDLDPRAILHPMALGRDLLPRRFGSHEALDLQARRTASRTQDIWGQGGYTLVYMGALERDTGAMLRLDVELFCSGLHDIIDRFPDQHIVNRLAAFCGMTMSGGNPKDTVRGRIQNCFGWITADHMRELHPAVWATAPVPSALQTHHPDNDAIRRGMSRALSALAECYSEHISTGHRLVFDGKGLSFVRAA